MIENSTQQNKLDSFIKSSLKEMEAPIDMGSWAKMEQRLDAAPSSPLKGSKMMFGALAASVIIIGSVLTYSYWPSGSNEPAAIEQVTAPPANIPPTSSEATTSAQELNAPESAETSLPINTEKEAEPVAETKVSDEKPEIIEKEIASKKEEKISEKENKKTGLSKEELEKEESENFIDVFNKLKKDQAPSFGDQIVPGKGFVKATEEEERLRREAMKKVRENALFGSDSLRPKQDSTGNK